MYEVHNMYFYIPDSIVSWHVEMMSNSIPPVVAVDVVEMALEAVHQTSFRLAYVLYMTYFACDAVYEITAFTVYPNLAGVLSIGDCASDSARLVYFGAVSAIVGYTW